MDAKLTYDQMGELLLMLLDDYVGFNGTEAYYRAADLMDDCIAVREAIRGRRI